MERVAIIGLGQIGSSMGLAIKRAKPQGVEVVGHDREPETAARARKIGAVDRYFYSLLETTENASLVILAIPVTAIRDVMGVISPVLQEGTIVTDTASTKADVLVWADELLPDSISFIGGHPMAGSEVPGLAGARADLFDEAVYCLIPSTRARPDAVRGIADLTKFVGASPFFVDAHEHDGLAAAISHLPIALSITLMNLVRKAPAWREMGKMGAGSFRDVSRLASGEPEMHRDIFLTNAPEVLRWIDAYIDELGILRQQIEERDQAGIHTSLRGAARARQAWLDGEHEIEDDLVTDAVELSFGGQMEQMFLGGKAAQIFREFRRKRKI